MYNPVEQYQKNIKLTNYFVQKWRYSFPPGYYDELLAEARVSLWRACCYFKPDRGAKFVTYVNRVINIALSDFYRVNKIYFRNYYKNISLQQSLSSENAYTPREMSEEIGYNIDFEDKTLYQMIMEEIDNYPILRMIILEGLTQADIARKLGRSRSLIGQKLSKERRNIIKKFHLKEWNRS